MRSAHTRASLGGPGLALTFLLCAGAGLPAHTLPATPVLGAGASEPRCPPAARAALCRPQPSLLPVLTQQQPQGMDGGPHGGLLWLPPLLNPMSPQAGAPGGAAGKFSSTRGGAQNAGGRRGQGAREPARVPSAFSAGDQPCPSSFGLGRPVHQGAPGSPSQGGSCPRSAHRNPSPRTLNCHLPRKDQRQFQRICPLGISFPELPFPKSCLSSFAFGF